MFRATLEMQFEYDEENFDGDLSDQQIKDMVQDNALANPGMVYDNIEVNRNPNPEDGLSRDDLTQLEKKEAIEVALSSLDIGDIFGLEESSEFFILTEVEMLGEHRDNVWSYVNAATGEFEGLLRDGACPEHYAETVYYYTHHNELGSE